MDRQEPLAGLEPTVEERTVEELVRGLRDFGLVDEHQNPRAGHDEARALLGYLQEAGLLRKESSPDSIRPKTEIAVELNRTCIAAPEQYDVLLDGRALGYLRLRHGLFRAHYPDPEGPEVYSASGVGDGVFDSEEIRVRELRSAIVELLKADGFADAEPIFEVEPFPEYEDYDEAHITWLEELAANLRKTESDRKQITVELGSNEVLIRAKLERELDFKDEHDRGTEVAFATFSEVIDSNLSDALRTLGFRASDQGQLFVDNGSEIEYLFKEHVAIPELKAQRLVDLLAGHWEEAQSSVEELETRGVTAEELAEDDARLLGQ